MDITVLGTGYVGLVYGACLADIGHKVLCLDINAEKISELQKGVLPIFEPGLSEIVQSCVKNGRLSFSTLENLTEIASELVMIAVGTPESSDGSADVSGVLSAAELIAKKMIKDTVIVTKSTVPVGTAEKIKKLVSEILEQRSTERLNVSVVSNPEFLKEGSAISDFRNPDRIVIGAEDDFGIESLTSLYKQFLAKGVPTIITDTRSAELLKYAANAMLATRISFMNEVANFAEKVGADIDAVKHGLSFDPRIGSKFLNPGIGYGGSCFPKDVSALISMADRTPGTEMKILEAVERVNTDQKMVLVQKTEAILGELSGKKMCIWGLAFKPNTDDTREAASLVVIQELISKGAKVTVFDPVATLPSQLFPEVWKADSALAAAKDADALLILTEWPEFTEVDLDSLGEQMPAKTILDGRNIFPLSVMREKNFHYYSVGRQVVNPLN